MSDERLIEIGAEAICSEMGAAPWQYLPDELTFETLNRTPYVRNMVREWMDAALTALRAAGYVILPPLNTPEGKEAVERTRLAEPQADAKAWMKKAQARLEVYAQEARQAVERQTATKREQAR